MGCRILLLNERDPRHPRSGGAEVHIAEVASRLAERGYETTLAACGFAGAPAHERVGALDVRRLGPLPVYYPRVAWLCARETRRGRFDVVVEHLNKLPFFSPLLSAAPVLVVCHHLFGRSAYLQVPWPIATAVVAAEQAIPLFYRHTDFVAVSESTRASLVARGIRAERIRVVYNGIRQPGADAGPPPSRRGMRVVYLGRVEPYKRVDLMLRALAPLVPRFPDLAIDVLGRGHDLPRLEQVARALGLADRTRFRGFVDDAERDAILARSRVCVCPSVKEGWGITVIEANAMGVPVVATDAPGLRDAVRDGETGLLVDSSDPASWSVQIERLLANDLLVDELSEAARAWSRQFDWDVAAEQMADAIDALRERP
jgi:glycosyltransferase involved in cell wall biosynthesis